MSKRHKLATPQTLDMLIEYWKETCQLRFILDEIQDWAEIDEEERLQKEIIKPILDKYNDISKVKELFKEGDLVNVDPEELEKFKSKFQNEDYEKLKSAVVEMEEFSASFTKGTSAVTLTEDEAVINVLKKLGQERCFRCWRFVLTKRADPYYQKPEFLLSMERSKLFKDGDRVYVKSKKKHGIYLVESSNYVSAGVRCVVEKDGVVDWDTFEEDEYVYVNYQDLKKV